MDLIENVPNPLMENQGGEKPGDEAEDEVFNNAMAPCPCIPEEKPINWS